MKPTDLQDLKPYATPRQTEYINALLKHGTNTKASAALGINQRTLERGMEAVRRKAARQGFAPAHDMVHTAPDGYNVRGVSTLYVQGEDGQKVSAQWVKTTADQAARDAAMRAAYDAMAQEIPRTKPVPPPERTTADLLNLYILTDYHLGMYAWGKETGADWDAEIAERLLMDWFTAAIESAPDAEVGIFGQLGDFLHWDGLDAVTPASGHVLDADTRFSALAEIAIRVIRKITAMLLSKHERVHIIIAEGNHDPASSVWMQKMTSALYEDEPRVTVDESVDPYYAYQHGKTALFFHHGHKRKPNQVDSVFAAKFREIFGSTTHAYAHMGHMHHDMKLETNLMTVEQHRTLASPDAYASRGGWLSGRSANVITYHKEYGKVGSLTLSPEMVAA